MKKSKSGIGQSQSDTFILVMKKRRTHPTTRKSSHQKRDSSPDVLWIGLLVLCAILFSCSSKSDAETKVPKSVDTFSNSENESLSEFSSEGFLVQSIEDDRLVSIRIAHMPSIHVNEEKDERTLSIKEGDEHDVKRIAISSTTYIPYLKAIGVEDRIVASSWANHILDAELKKKVGAGEIVDLTRGEKLDLEQLVLSKADILFYDPAEGDLASKAERLGVLAIPIQEYEEYHPLARADWLRCFGALLGKSDQAKKVNEEIRSRYLSLAQKVADQSYSPSVLMGSIYQGKWFAPPSNSLAAQWIRDAGGSYVLEGRETGSNITLDMEELLSLGAEINWFGHMGFGPFDANELVQTEARLTEISAINENKIFYCNTKEMDYFGAAILEPDVILADIITVLHPGVLDDHVPRYFIDHSEDK